VLTRDRSVRCPELVQSSLQLHTLFKINFNIIVLCSARSMMWPLSLKVFDHSYICMSFLRNSVTIVTMLRAGRPGFDFRCLQNFFFTSSSKLVLGPTQAPIQSVAGASFSGSKGTYLGPRLRMHRAIPSLPHTSYSATKLSTKAVYLYLPHSACCMFRPSHHACSHHNIIN